MCFCWLIPGFRLCVWGELGLTEFQVVTRQQPGGGATLWIPLEPTLIEQGFEKAFASGVAQYYEKVIEGDGIEKGEVQVYDF